MRAGTKESLDYFALSRRYQGARIPGLALLGLMVRVSTARRAVTDTEGTDDLAVPLAIPVAIDVRYGG